MYKSLKRWLNTSIQIKPFTTRNGAGDKSYGTTVNLKCYPEGKMTQVIGISGNQTLSTIQLYIEGTTTIKVTDLVVYNSVTYEIKALGEFYDGKGARDIWVVYL